MSFGAALAALLAFASPAHATTEDRCDVPAIFAEPLAQLQRATIAARKDRKLDVLVLSGTPSQTGATKGLRSYPLFFARPHARKVAGS